MNEIGKYLQAIGRYWITLVTGTALMASVWLAKDVMGWKAPESINVILAVSAVLIASYLAWKEQHLMVLELKKRLNRNPLRPIGIREQLDEHIIHGLTIIFRIEERHDPRNVWWGMVRPEIWIENINKFVRNNFDIKTIDEFEGNSPHSLMLDAEEKLATSNWAKAYELSEEHERQLNKLKLKIKKARKLRNEMKG